MGFSVDQLVIAILNYNTELQNWIIELNYLFMKTLIRIKLLEFIYWNIDWDWINLLNWIYIHRYWTLIHQVHIPAGLLYTNLEHLINTFICKKQLLYIDDLQKVAFTRSSVTLSTSSFMFNTWWVYYVVLNIY